MAIARWRLNSAPVCIALVVVSGCSGVARTTVVPRVRLTDSPQNLVFSWPAGGEITSIFGPRWGRHHDGIDISAPEGTPVRAAAPGIVVFSGLQRGYGNIIIIEHPNGLSTAYAHNRKNLVDPGMLVSRGMLIAMLGRTGRVSGPNLHFEVRHGNVPRDPLEYLPLGEPLLATRSAPELGG